MHLKKRGKTQTKLFTDSCKEMICEFQVKERPGFCRQKILNYIVYPVPIDNITMMLLENAS